MILSILHTPNGNLLELCVEDGTYATRLFQYVEGSEREMSVTEAKDLQHTIRAMQSLGTEAVAVMDVR